MFSLSPIILTLLTLSLLSPPIQAQQPPPAAVCIVGAGIGGSSVAHFLRRYAPPGFFPTIRIFERNGVVGGRMATVSVAGETFEAGASILHPKNYHALNYTKLLGLKIKKPSSSNKHFSLGIWNGKEFAFRTFSVKSRIPFLNVVVSLANSLRVFLRYGFSLLRMESFVESTVNKFLKYYESFESRPVFETVDDMLKWAGLYNLTRGTLEEKLSDARLSPLLIHELITVITRVNYGQNVCINGLAGAVSLAGSDGGLWAVKGGNWQMAAGLINRSDVSLHLHEEVESISYLNGNYELNSSKGNHYTCDVTVVATPLDELNTQFIPPVSLPERKLQHTHATFVSGLLNPAYFGVGDVSEIPELVGTIDNPAIPFSSISVLKKYDENNMIYKIFSSKAMSDALLDHIFSVRRETIRINWGAYPHYNAPEVFAPFILDDQHLYYVNAFENAASTMETSAVAAENIARLILSRCFSNLSASSTHLTFNSDVDPFHLDL